MLILQIDRCITLSHIDCINLSPFLSLAVVYKFAVGNIIVTKLSCHNKQTFNKIVLRGSSCGG